MEFCFNPIFGGGVKQHYKSADRVIRKREVIKLDRRGWWFNFVLLVWLDKKKGFVVGEREFREFALRESRLKVKRGFNF
jgi:hypothetical protein